MEPRKILIRGPNWVGDAVLSVPAIRAVRERFPQAEITLLVRPWVAGLFASADFVDVVWNHAGTGVAAWIGTARAIRRHQFEVAVLLPNSFESAWTAFAGGIPERAGYATDGRNFLLTRPVSVPAVKQHQTAYYLGLIDALFGPVTPPPLQIRAGDRHREAARRLLKSEGVDPDKGILIVNPGAAYGSAKRWHEERFAGAADRLADALGLEAVIIGSARERRIGERVRDLMRRRATVLSGRTELETLVGLVAGAGLMITNDSGPMHIAAALGVPTVAIFGSTDAEVTGPVGPRTRIVRHEVSCSPCLLRECPIDHRCMEAVTVDEVFTAGVAVKRDAVAAPHESLRHYGHDER